MTRNEQVKAAAREQVQRMDETLQDSTDTMKQQSASNETEEDTAPSIAALVGMIVTGLLYAALPPNLIIGPNWLLLVLEAVFIAPLLISIVIKKRTLTRCEASSCAATTRHYYVGTRCRHRSLNSHAAD